jgi:DNA polymerase I-like protein with 3'-5' exonuclease and polymerase domains
MCLMLTLGQKLMTTFVGHNEIYYYGKKVTQGALFDSPSTTPEVGKALPPLPNLDGIDRLGFDSETTTEPWLFDRTLVGLSYYLPDGRKRYIPLRHPGGGNYEEANVREWLWREAQGKELVCVNAKHEVHTFNKWGVSFEAQGCAFMDCFHQAALLNDKRRNTNMDLLVKEEFPDYPKSTVDHSQLHLMPAAQAAPVAIEDAELAFRLAEVYQPRIQAEELEDVLQLENDLVFSTCEMERNGSYLNIELLLRWGREVEEEYQRRVMAIHQLTGLKVYPTKSTHMTKLFNHLGIENRFKTETGEDSFEEDSLVEYVQAHPAVALALEARQISSLNTKYLKKYLASIRPDGRVYYSLHQLRGDEGGTITGRYSSSAMYKTKDGGINIQQVTKTKKMPKLLQRWPIRKLFVPPAGRVYFSSDASQIEFRLFAHYASTKLGKDRLAKCYRDNPKTDFHDLVMRWTGQNRDHTKNINFRKLYGGGPKKGMWMINKQNKLDGRPLISLRDAYAMDDKYDAQFPEANELLAMAQAQAENKGFVRTLLGRRGRFTKGDPQERYYRALNIVLQGGATGDLVKLKIRHLYQERKRLGIVMRDQCHDEINGDLPSAAELPTAAAFMNEQEYELKVPILWESGTGPNWEECH